MLARLLSVPLTLVNTLNQCDRERGAGWQVPVAQPHTHSVYFRACRRRPRSGWASISPWTGFPRLQRSLLTNLPSLFFKTLRLEGEATRPLLVLLCLFASWLGLLFLVSSTFQQGVCGAGHRGRQIFSDASLDRLPVKTRT